jgi:hypothetical protein
MIFVGAHMAGGHHDVHVLDKSGSAMATHRLPTGIAGAHALHTVLAGLAGDPGRVSVGVDVDRGLWVSALVAAGYQVWVVDPSAVARRRASSAVIDAVILADVVRTDRDALRAIAGNSQDAVVVHVLGRSHQSLLWSRSRHANALRELLAVYHPAALEAFADVTDRDALTVLGVAPGPEDAARLSVPEIGAVLKSAGRQRLVADRARRVQAALQREHQAAAEAEASAAAIAVTAAVRVITELDAQIDAAETALAAHVETHPDAEIYRRLPELRLILAARLLGEFENHRSDA